MRTKPIALALFMAFGASCAHADEAALKAEIDELRTQLQQLKDALKQAPAAATPAASSEKSPPVVQASRPAVPAPASEADRGAPAIAPAETPAPGVALYGTAFVNVENVRAKGGTTPVLSRTRLVDESSRLGVKGAKVLAPGLKGWFQLETSFHPNQNDQATVIGSGGGTVSGSSWANRNSAVGLAHDAFGTVLLGRWDTPFKQTQNAVADPYFDNNLGDNTAAAERQGTFSQRAQNVIQYWSPVFSGVQAKVGYVPNFGRTATANPTLTSVSVSWMSAGRRWSQADQANVSNLYFAVAAEKHHNMIGQTATAGVDETGYAATGYWRVGPVKLGGQYGEYSRTGVTKNKGYFGSAEWAFWGKHTALLMYQVTEGGAAAGAVQPKCDVLAPGYRYRFSPEFLLIASYVKVKNKEGSLCNFGDSSLSITSKQNPEGASLGMQYTF